MTQAAHLEERELYLQDCRETTKPWLRWRVSDPRYLIWVPLVVEPDWNPKHLFQRIPQTITINGIEVNPAPLTVAPSHGEMVYLCTPDKDKLFIKIPFYPAADQHQRLLLRGLLHATKEAAIAHAKALILASGGVV